MKYIVITSKHHDGFCLFDSKDTDFDVMATPFQRDILKELSDACRKQGMNLCFYHSIMDWHHPDYLPRRPWEEKDRPAAGAKFDRYVQYMKAQLKELVTNYGPIGVLWFDGEWENTWTEAYGKDLYRYVRTLQPSIIVNNRVGAGRSGMEGFSQDKESAGDFGTPEQQIPATGLPGVDWETCMTMNDHWGYNSHDQNWKSAKEIVRMLVDIASKGGNYLLNVGPTAEGVFPQPSIDRLREIGAWMKVNGEAIYGTQASPFKSLAWGRCTQKAAAGGTRLYLHVFDWPADGKLVVPGLLNAPKSVTLLTASGRKALKSDRDEDALVISVPAQPPDATDSVVEVAVAGKPDISDPPVIQAAAEIFTDTLEVMIVSGRENVEIRYTIDGAMPTAASPRLSGLLHLTGTAVVSARAFRDGKPVSGAARARFEKVAPRPAESAAGLMPGLAYQYFEGDWDALPDFSKLKPAAAGVLPAVELAPRKAKERYGLEFEGFLKVPSAGVYTFFLESDDGSRLFLGGDLLVDNDGLHGMIEKKGVAALAAGPHRICVRMFNKTGGEGLRVSWQRPGGAKEAIPASALFHGGK